MCWNCGKREATQIVYGYPVCNECEDIDPEEMELVVIESLAKGHIIPLDTIKKNEK